MTSSSAGSTQLGLQPGVEPRSEPPTTLPRDRAREVESLEHELKFVLPAARARLALTLLRSACRPDAEYPHGIVTTIYYDTPDMRSLAEKINSDYLKTKLRLRWYSPPDAPDDGGPAFLEVKARIGARRDKVRLPIPYRGSSLLKLPLHDPRLKALPTLLRAEGCLLDPTLDPIVTIRYERYRMIEPSSGARVSMDTGITVLAVNHRIRPPQRPTQLPIAVIEVKADLVDLPPALYGVTALGARKQSLSKYGAAFRYPLEGIL